MQVKKLSENQVKMQMQNGSPKIQQGKPPCGGAQTEDFTISEEYTDHFANNDGWAPNATPLPPSPSNRDDWIQQQIQNYFTTPGQTPPAQIPSPSFPIVLVNGVWNQSPQMSLFLTHLFNTFGVNPNLFPMDGNEWTNYKEAVYNKVEDIYREQYCKQWRSEVTKILNRDKKDCEKGVAKVVESNIKYKSFHCDFCLPKYDVYCHDCRKASDCAPAGVPSTCYECKMTTDYEPNYKKCFTKDPAPEDCVTPTPTPSPSPSPSPTKSKLCTALGQSCQDLGYAENCSCKNSQGQPCDGGDILCECKCECDCSIIDQTGGTGEGLDPSCKPECCCDKPGEVNPYKNTAFCKGTGFMRPFSLDYQCFTPTPTPTPTSTPVPTPTATPAPTSTPAPTPTPPPTYMKMV